GSGVAILADAHRRPVVEGDAAGIAAAGDAGRAAVLLAAASAVGEGVVDGDDGALVGGERHDVPVVGVDPDVLVVVAARGTAPAGEAMAAVGGPPGGLGGVIDDVLVTRIHRHDLLPARHVRVAVGAGPARAAVVGAEEAAARAGDGH